ncbi:DUF3949 domain-containing protein [Bacillus sp. 165]|uniref:DUF3949 domain-containing protein n=1 Tax=Bacillus sp. 165 TaxID=1529117 RepID=UPI001ADB49D1|nr:DUF3949 domain-containing protein [Bacillus sp. 165]MBO9130892.1 DUF3949 domain-containing protein [Bacillus sp. 165]
MFSAFWLLLVIYLIYFLVMIPVQYRILAGLKERQTKTSLSQSELYENMSFEEEQLHFHNQGNLFNLPSAIVANTIYKLKHRK